MEEKMTLEKASKLSYDLGRKLYELKVAKELTKDKEKIKEIERYIDNTTKELKKVLLIKATLKDKKKEGNEHDKYKGK